MLEWLRKVGEMLVGDDWAIEGEIWALEGEMLRSVGFAVGLGSMMD